MLLISATYFSITHTHTFHIENEERNSGVEKQKSCVVGAIVNYGERGVVLVYKSFDFFCSILKVI